MKALATVSIFCFGYYMGGGEIPAAFYFYVFVVGALMTGIYCGVKLREGAKTARNIQRRVKALTTAPEPVAATPEPAKTKAAGCDLCEGEKNLYIGGVKSICPKCKGVTL